MSVQPIAGVSSQVESVVMTEYPSIGAWMPGRALGRLYNCIPIRLFGLTVSHLIFVLPTAPVAIALYFLQKAFGQYFVLTNRSVQIWAVRSGRRAANVELSKVAAAEVVNVVGQEFFKAGDIVLRSATGEVLERLRGIPDAPSFCNAIRCTVEARRMVQSSKAAIEARG